MTVSVGLNQALKGQRGRKRMTSQKSFAAELTGGLTLNSVTEAIPGHSNVSLRLGSPLDLPNVAAHRPYTFRRIALLWSNRAGVW